MDAAQTSREMEQHISGLSTATGLTAGQIDAFGIHLASLLASSTESQCSCRTEISPVCGGTTPLETGNRGRAETSKTVLTQLAEQVIGQQVTITTLEDTLAPPLANQTAAPLVQFGAMQLTSGTVYSEQQSLLFSAQGSVRTTDGREINFDLGLSMERTTVAVQTAAMDVAPLFIDPLILQFDLDSPLLGDTTFLFDLDSDGDLEDLACPGSGCGFLAFDRNGDGTITNGLELFGPNSGSGFGELAELDSDHNQWIDESDPLFDQLCIWTQDGHGGGSLRSLREAGVGALAVTHAGTDFQLQQADGTPLGTIKGSGLFLTENGEVRPLHEVDLALPSSRIATAPQAMLAANSRSTDSLQALRDIISMQRLRMRMMLTGERLRGALTPQRQERELFRNWLQARNLWQSLLERQFEQPFGLNDDVAASSGKDQSTETMNHI
jgi:hypothetical protein